MQVEQNKLIQNPGMKVIIINGAAASGKDQFVKYFQKHYPYQCCNWSTIDKVKEIAQNHLGWDGEKIENARLFLSELKRIWSDYNNGPFQWMVKKIDSHYQEQNDEDKSKVVYFIHCRESDEIQKFKATYGNKCHTLLIQRDGMKMPENKSDKNVGRYPYDFINENNGDLNELEIKARNFAKSMARTVINQ